MAERRNPEQPAQPEAPPQAETADVQAAPLGRLGELERAEQVGQNRQAYLTAIQQRREAIEANGEYGVEDLAALASQRWHTHASLVRAALAAAGVQRISLADADALVAEFRDREA